MIILTKNDKEFFYYFFIAFVIGILSYLMFGPYVFGLEAYHHNFTTKWKTIIAFCTGLFWIILSIFPLIILAIISFLKTKENT